MRSIRINKIADLIGARRYLEIGVAEGQTFFDVRVSQKVAVDPKFQFDPASKTQPGVEFFQISSDKYFESTEHLPFDLIYLDGMHTFEQTLRDFINSLSMSHCKTVWLIDDTMPNDFFSALPDQERCFRLRHSMGNTDWSWMGDVYKLVFFVRVVMKFFHFRTFAGHGQTVIWRDYSGYDERQSVALANVSGMTYEDFLENSALMNIAPDEEIYAAIALSHAGDVSRLQTQPKL